MNGRLVIGNPKVRRMWKEYFKDQYNIDTQEQVTVNLAGSDGARRGNYFRGEPIRRTEVEVRVGKLKNGEAASKDDVRGEIIKRGADRVVDWIWRLCNIVFHRGFVPKDWISAVIIPLYKGKGERAECKNYRGISLLRVVAKIYP